MTRRKKAALGEIVAAAYEGAAALTSNPTRASRIAASAVVHILPKNAGPAALRRLARG